MLSELHRTRPHAAGSRQFSGAVSHRITPVTSSIRSIPQHRQQHVCAATQLKDVLELLINKQDLTEKQAQDTMMDILKEFSPEQASAFLVLLRAKGETAAEVAGLAKAMMTEVQTVHAQHDVVDIVGTGGDGIGSVNISTGACIIAAAAGARVAKHGNRSVSSLCGSADVLEALGVAIDLGPQGVQRCIAEAGLGFMYAPRYHPAMKRIRPIRSALKIRTIFNILVRRFGSRHGSRPQQSKQSMQPGWCLSVYVMHAQAAPCSQCCNTNAPYGNGLSSKCCFCFSSARLCQAGYMHALPLC